MARLRDGKKAQVSNQIHALIRRHDFGLRETEIAEMAGMDRRRLNNYLRDLQANGKIYKDGRCWHADR